MGFPYCWVHAKKIYGVQRKDSAVPGAGKGLFATKDFSVNEWIVPYGGESITARCLDLRYPGDTTAPYAVDDTRNRYIDGACVRGLGSLANGNFNGGGYALPWDQHNAEIADRPNREKWIKAIEDIYSGDEIFVYYGDDYFLDDDHRTFRSSRGEQKPC